MSSSTPGLFLALEGPDGSGKTTQAARLVQWLRGRVPKVVACREPGGTELGERLRSIVLDRSATVIGLRAEMLLYMASRAELVEEIIRPALDEGAVVVTDRFLLSNVVYQGYAGGLDVDEIWRVGQAATGGLMPDLTLLVDVAPEVAAERVGRPRDRLEDRPEAYRRKVRDGYLSAIKTCPKSWAVVDGSGDPDSVFEKIRIEVECALGTSSRP